MVRCAGKPKPFAKRIGAVLLLGACMAQSVEAATTFDVPILRLSEAWPSPVWVSNPGLAHTARFPERVGLSPEDRVAIETILLEAAGDGFESMVAVGEAIRNRTQLFKKSVREVCLQPKQFSGWNDRPRAERFLTRHRSHYGRAWLAWKISAISSLTGGATDYHTQDIRPYWASAYQPSARVGSHIFYVRQARRIRGE